MSSEQHRDLPIQPEPTCPMIDNIIKRLEQAERSMRGYQKSDDLAELRGMLDSIDSDLFGWSGSLEARLEAIRKHVERIREWGEGWKQYALKCEEQAESHEASA